MALPVTIPNTFANATASIPLSQLDTNFTTLANAVNGISDGSESLANVSVTGGTISNVAVSATTLNTSGAVVFNDAGADVDFRVESDTKDNALFVDGASGSVGIGVTPSAWGGGSGLSVLQMGGSSFSFLSANKTQYIYGNAYYDGTNNRYINSDYACSFGVNTSGGYQWNIAPSGTAGNTISFTQAMTLDSSGNLLVGTTTAGVSNSISTSIEASGLNNSRIYVNHSSTGSSNGSLYMGFGYGGATIGSITQASTTTVAYNTSSDYRLKQDIQPMTGALEKVLELKPCTYTWKEDGSAGEGFIAHELQEIAPYAVSGEKDGEEMQGVDYGKITPLLTAALQEAITEIQSLKARVAELEAK